MKYGSYKTGATHDQLKKLKELGYNGPFPKSSREASIQISKLIPPSELSKNYLRTLNYSDKEPKTEYDADILIDKLKNPTQNQLELIKKMGGKIIPKSNKEASEMISSLSNVTKSQQIFLEKYNIRKVPRNRKEASDIIDQYQNKTLKQPDPCPKCEGNKKYEDGSKTYDPCPYCEGYGIEEWYDENKGDQKISELDNEEYENEFDEDN